MCRRVADGEGGRHDLSGSWTVGYVAHDPAELWRLGGSPVVRLGGGENTAPFGQRSSFLAEWLAEWLVGLVACCLAGRLAD